MGGGQPPGRDRQACLCGRAVRSGLRQRHVRDVLRRAKEMINHGLTYLHFISLVRSEGVWRTYPGTEWTAESQ